MIQTKFCNALFKLFQRLSQVSARELPKVREYVAALGKVCDRFFLINLNENEHENDEIFLGPKIKIELRIRVITRVTVRNLLGAVVRRHPLQARRGAPARV